MSLFKSVFACVLAASFVSLVLTQNAEAQSRKRGGKGVFAGGSFSIGAGVALTTAEQSGLNGMIDAAKSSAASTVSKFGSATEYLGYLTFRFSSGFVALQLRPTLFSQSTSGSGSDGSHKYDLSGYTVFPLVRIIPLSNDIIDFYLQTGIGYGKLNGSIRNGSRSVDFTGSAFGAQLGLGAEFCIVASHCIGVEGNYRYLPIERNLATSGTGPGNLPYGSTQASVDNELEDMNGRDVATTMSGISGSLSYTYNF